MPVRAPPRPSLTPPTRPPANTTAGVKAAIRSAWMGLVAGCLHTLAGADHLAALTPLTIGRSHWKASLLGALWGFGHSTGQASRGLGWAGWDALAGCLLSAGSGTAEAGSEADHVRLSQTEGVWMPLRRTHASHAALLCSAFAAADDPGPAHGRVQGPLPAGALVLSWRC